jgi:hypothetical protein
MLFSSYTWIDISVYLNDDILELKLIQVYNCGLRIHIMFCAENSRYYNSFFVIGILPITIHIKMYIIVSCV